MTHYICHLRQRSGALVLNLGLSLGLGLGLSLGLGGQGAWAGDPFRSVKPQPIGPATEAAFLAAFRDGNYLEADRQLQVALKSETKEPLAHSLAAALAYLEQDWPKVKTYADQTRTAAEQLKTSQPLRHHLYRAIATFLDGAYAMTPAGEGNLQGMSTALGKLQQVYADLNAAKRIDPKDPELNLIQGFMDVFIATVLPLSSPEDAIKRLEASARPSYLVDFGVALARRNLKQYDEALLRLDKAIAASPSPEFYYLKAQILASQAKQKSNDKTLLQQARSAFSQALSKPERLPKTRVADIFLEACQNQGRLLSQDLNCRQQRRQLLSTPERWGNPKAAPLALLTPAKPQGVPQGKPGLTPAKPSPSLPAQPSPAQPSPAQTALPTQPKPASQTTRPDTARPGTTRPMAGPVAPTLPSTASKPIPKPTPKSTPKSTPSL